MTEVARRAFGRLLNGHTGAPADFRLGVLPSATVDAGLFEQVWTNLLSNAMKYSSRQDRPLIEVRGEEQEHEVVYSVRDNGVGFNPQFASKLFQTFQRLHQEKDFPGTGIGLALVHRIVTRHGGRVWADGAVDAGATFYFSLPRN